MEQDVFKKFLHKYLKGHGFTKVKSKYYLKGNKFTCMIDLQRSYYGPTYYINYTFFLGEFENPNDIIQDNMETYSPNVGSRFYFTEKDKYSCDYLDYDEEKLKALLDKNLAERIIPPFEQGKKYLKEHFGTLYTSFLLDERVVPFLED
ncbi:MAG: DUF4304 domain-containing protein [Clostridia bacterium]|nr:DUF4304 domain-containing protein [Clostridia bacterium]